MPTRTGHAEPPLQSLHDYAFIADGERGGVIGPLGDVVWLCFPGWSDPALCARLLGGDGTYVVTPAEPAVWGGYYEEGSLIWHSRWATRSGLAECHEALAMPSSRDRAILLRRVVSLEHALAFDVRLDLRMEYGRQPLRDVKRNADGTWTASGPQLHLRWSGARGARIDPRTGALHLRLELPARGAHDLVLELGRTLLPRHPPEASKLWEATRKSWNKAEPSLEGIHGRRDARLALAVLRGLTSETGAMAAAGTMSLPERAELRRNYDYRYAWIRDQSFAGQAAGRCGDLALLDGAVRFVTERLLDDGPGLKPAYTVTGEPVPGERQLPLPGYPGASPVFAGNKAGSQFQLDGFGEVLLLYAEAARRDRLDACVWRAAGIAARAIEERWTEPDSGIWEIRPELWTHSRLICAAGLAELARFHPDRAARRRWERVARGLVEHLRATATAPSGAWKRSVSDPGVDAALLIASLRSDLLKRDPRTRATVAAVEQSLVDHGYVYRFRHGRVRLGTKEGAFLLCQFWLSLAHLSMGDAVRAMQAFELGRAASGSPGLFAEEFDQTQRQQRGNLPQAFVHATLLDAARQLGEYLQARPRSRVSRAAGKRHRAPRRKPGGR